MGVEKRMEKGGHRGLAYSVHFPGHGVGSALWVTSARGVSDANSLAPLVCALEW